MDRGKEVLSPIEVVSKEIGRRTSLSEEASSSSIRRLLVRLLEDSSEALGSDPYSELTAQRVLEYRLAAEIVVMLGELLSNRTERS